MRAYTQEEIEAARQTREDIINFKKDFLMNVFEAGEIYSWSKMQEQAREQKKKNEQS